MSNEPYQIGSGLSEQEMHLASWWVRHHLLLHRLGYGSLTALCVLLWGYSFWQITDAFILKAPYHSRISTNINRAFLTRQTFDQLAPRSIQPTDVQVFNLSDGRRDFYSVIQNPNPNWWAEFEYQFVTNEGTRTPPKKSFILPNSTRSLTEIGWSSSSTASTADLSVNKIQWHRLDPAKTEKDYGRFNALRLQLFADDIKYANDLTVGTTRVGQTSFILRNGSGYGYWSTEVTVRLYRGDTLTGVTTVTERDIEPGENRPITINWFDNPNDISRTEVELNVNILDPNAYLPIRSE